MTTIAKLKRVRATCPTSAKLFVLKLAKDGIEQLANEISALQERSSAKAGVQSMPVTLQRFPVRWNWENSVPLGEKAQRDCTFWGMFTLDVITAGAPSRAQPNLGLSQLVLSSTLQDAFGETLGDENAEKQIAKEMLAIMNKGYTIGLDGPSVPGLCFELERLGKWTEMSVLITFRPLALLKEERQAYLDLLVGFQQDLSGWSSSELSRLWTASLTSLERGRNVLEAAQPSEEFFIGKINQGLCSTSDFLGAREQEFLLTRVVDWSGNRGLSAHTAKELMGKCILALSTAYSEDVSIRHKHAVFEWRQHNTSLYSESPFCISPIVQEWYLTQGRKQEKRAVGCLPTIIAFATVFAMLCALVFRLVVNVERAG